MTTPAHILGGQETVRDAGLCGELTDDATQMCVREAGHEGPRGRWGATVVPEMEHLRIRRVLMYAIGFIEGVAAGIQLAGPMTHDQLAERMREAAIELREQT